MLRQSYNVDIGYIYRYLKLSVLWLHIVFSPLMRVDRALCRAPLHTVHDPHDFINLCALVGQITNLIREILFDTVLMGTISDILPRKL